MQSWFIWKGINSREMGIWVKKLPAETRAEERITLIEVPGRSGHLTMLEGDAVYNSYLKECTVIGLRDANFDRLSDWLSGEGDVIFSSTPNRAYTARIAGAVSFDNISNDLCQCKIPFYVQPLKKQVPTEADISCPAGSTTTIYNPGTVTSKPIVYVPPICSVTIAGREMSFSAPAFSQYTNYRIGDYVGYGGYLYRFKETHAAGAWDNDDVNLITSLAVDCEAKVILANTGSVEYIYTGTFTGEFWELPVGNSTVVTPSGGIWALVRPRWRWR